MLLQFIRRVPLGIYRLVNIMHILGKLTENTKTQIAEYIEKHTLLRESQLGFSRDLPSLAKVKVSEG